MNEDILFFFDKHMDAMPLYEAFESRVLKEIENVRIKVQKSQISFITDTYLPVFLLQR